MHKCSSARLVKILLLLVLFYLDQYLLGVIFFNYYRAISKFDKKCMNFKTKLPVFTQPPDLHSNAFVQVSCSTYVMNYYTRLAKDNQ